MISDREKDLNHDIYEYGEAERELANMAQFTVPGTLWHRFFLWCERLARSQREKCIAERNAIRNQERNKHGK